MRTKTVERVCAVCSQSFQAALRQIAYGTGTTCSKRCRFELHFWARVEKTDTCWIWTGATGGGGYGSVWDPAARSARPAHVMSWELANMKSAPAGLDGLHTCDNRPCVRPDHVFFGTDADNVADMIAKDRHARGTRNGHSLLVDSDVLEIRHRKASGESSSSLAEAFGIERRHVDSIYRGKLWSHLPGAVVRIDEHTGPPRAVKDESLVVRLRREGLTWKEVALRLEVTFGEARGAYFRATGTWKSRK